MLAYVLLLAPINGIHAAPHSNMANIFLFFVFCFYFSVSVFLLGSFVFSSSASTASRKTSAEDSGTTHSALTRVLSQEYCTPGRCLSWCKSN